MCNAPGQPQGGRLYHSEDIPKTRFFHVVNMLPIGLFQWPVQHEKCCRGLYTLEDWIKDGYTCRTWRLPRNASPMVAIFDQLFVG